MDFSKSNPGCWHSLLKYLSEKSGISITKEIAVKNVWKITKSGKKKLQYGSQNITVIDINGQRHPYMIDIYRRFDVIGIVADHFLVKIYRKVDEFGIKVNSAGNYKDSLGGGWHSNCNLYEIDGKYFADMECACR